MQWQKQEMDLWKSTGQVGLKSLPSGKWTLAPPLLHNSSLSSSQQNLNCRRVNVFKHVAGIKQVIPAQIKPLKMLIRSKWWQNMLIILIKVDSGLFLFSTVIAAAWLRQGSTFVVFFILFGAQWKSVLLNLHRCGKTEQNKQVCLHRIEKWFAYLRFCGNYQTVQPHNMSKFL